MRLFPRRPKPKRKVLFDLPLFVRICRRWVVSCHQVSRSRQKVDTFPNVIRWPRWRLECLGSFLECKWKVGPEKRKFLSKYHILNVLNNIRPLSRLMCSLVLNIPRRIHVYDVPIDSRRRHLVRCLTVPCLVEHGTRVRLSEFSHLGSIGGYTRHD